MFKYLPKFLVLILYLQTQPPTLKPPFLKVGLCRRLISYERETRTYVKCTCTAPLIYWMVLTHLHKCSELHLSQEVAQS